MKRLVFTSFVAVAVLAVIASGVALAHGDNGKGARLNGFQETPSISTTGHGTFKARLRSDGIHYVLRYADLEANATVAHIHFGQRHTAGGIAAFLCGGGDKPACPARQGRVEGVIDAADVLAIPTQGIEAGALREVVRALRHGAIYANVHTATFGNGEIRGQVGGNDDGKRGDDRG